MILSRQSWSYFSELEHSQSYADVAFVYILTIKHTRIYKIHARAHTPASTYPSICSFTWRCYFNINHSGIRLALTGWFYPLSLLLSYKNSDFAEWFRQSRKMKDFDVCVTVSFDVARRVSIHMHNLVAREWIYHRRRRPFAAVPKESRDYHASMTKPFVSPRVSQKEIAIVCIYIKNVFTLSWQLLLCRIITWVNPIRYRKMWLPSHLVSR